MFVVFLVVIAGCCHIQIVQHNTTGK